MKKPILITGATGFIGRNVVKDLNKNYQLTALVRDLDKANTVLPFFCKKIKFFLGKDKNQTLGGFDTVIHLAADVSYFSGYKNLYQTNVFGTKQLIEALPNLKHFIYASSIEAAQPKTAYGQTKKEAEDLIINLASKVGFKYTILRLGNIYGPNNSFVFSELAKLIKNSNSYLNKFYPYCQQVKIFPIYITDVLRALVKILNKKIYGQFTLLGLQSYTIKQLVEFMKKVLHRPLQKKDAFASPFVLQLRQLWHKLTGKADFLDYLLFKAEEKYIKKQKKFPLIYKVGLKEGIIAIFQ